MESVPQDWTTSSCAFAAGSILQSLRRGKDISLRTTVLVAHPDDETISVGSRLAAFRTLTLAEATDGSPADMSDARTLGFSDRAAYAATRAKELKDALSALGVAARLVSFNLPDQDLVRHLVALTRRLRARCGDCDILLTHAYEGGHPDHDALAFAAQAACALLACEGQFAPLRLEFAGYHMAAGQRVTGRFCPEPDCPPIAARISEQQLKRKLSALACFKTQQHIVTWFAPQTELYRVAPVYDFTAPPPPGAALYDTFGWTITSELWRKAARAALQELGLLVPCG